jgi:hypothetical protein
MAFGHRSLIPSRCARAGVVEGGALLARPAVVSLSNHVGRLCALQPSFDKLRTVLGDFQAEVKHGSLPSPSLGLNTTFTFCPTFTFAGSTSTMLVIMETPSSSVT